MGERSYEQWCPVTRALDLVGDRWTLLIVRDLCFGTRRYSQLRAELRGISPTLLSQRLSRLVADGLVNRGDDGYELTARGRELWPVVAELGRFGLATMGRRPAGDAFHAHFPRAGLGFMVRIERLPRTEFRAQVVLDDEPLGLVVSAPDPDVAPHHRITVHPGAPEHPRLRVETSLVTLWQLRHGLDTADAAVTAGRLVMAGSPAARRTFCELVGP